MKSQKSMLAALVVTLVVVGPAAASSTVREPVAEGAPVSLHARHSTGIVHKATDQRPKAVRYLGRH